MVVVSALNEVVYKQLIDAYERLKKKGALEIDSHLYKDLYGEFDRNDVWILHDNQWEGFLILLRSGDGIVLNPYFFTGVPLVGPGLESLRDQLMEKALELFETIDCNRIYVSALKDELLPEDIALLIDHGIVFDYTYVDMRCQLPNKVKKPKKPEGILLRRVMDYSNEALKICFDEIYKKSDVAYYHNLSDKEKCNFYEDVCFEGVFDHLCSIALEVEGELAGYVLVFDYGKQPYIANMCMRTAYRNKGYGSYMLKVLKFLASEKGYTSIGLGTELKMRAFKLYLAHGFEVDRQRDYYVKHQ